MNLAIQAQVLRLLEARDEFVRQRARADLAAPPATEPAAEHDWVAGEVLAHCAEMLPYWLGEIERILATYPEPEDLAVPFGRVASDEVRSLTIDRDRSLPVGELYVRVSAGVDRAAVRLLELDDREAARVGLHPTRGEMTVVEIVDRFIAGHLEEHARQLGEALDAALAEA